MSDDKRKALEDAIDRLIEYTYDMGIARTEATVKFALENRERYRVQVLAMFDAQQSRIEELEKAKTVADEWVLVPKKPTKQMLAAAKKEVQDER